MSFMFGGCSSLKSLDLSSFRTNNVDEMKLMFEGCNSLKKNNIKINHRDNKIQNQINDL